MNSRGLRSFSPTVGTVGATRMTSSSVQSSRRQLVTPNHRQQISTPGSARSSIGDLEETISNIMGVRMHSLSDLRSRIEQLSELHRREEAAFKNQMGMVLEQSEVARLQQQRSIDDYEKLLAKERAERQRLITMMAAFKHEGGLVMNTLKDSLAEVTKKYKMEVDNSSSQRSSSGQCANDDAVEALKNLLDEADNVIVELEQRNRHLESKMSHLQSQRGHLLDIEAQHFQSDEFHHEFNQLLSQIRAHDNSSGQTLQSVRGQLDTMSKYAKLLVNKLNVEQRQRLRAEEQAAHFAAAQDQRVAKLEARLKELEGHERGGGGGGGGGRVASPRMDRTSPVVSAPPRAQHAPPIVPMLKQPLIRQESAASTATSSEGPVILSLEEQLNNVSSEFHHSVQQWQKSLRSDQPAGPNLVSPADEEFLPDSPRSL